MMTQKKILLLMMIAFFLGCREPYDPAIENGVSSSLVVEGMINAEGVTTIQLSRTRSISEKESKQTESKAIIEIEGDNNSKFALTDQGEGVYRSAYQSLPRDRRYRLRIKTSAGKEYLSAFAAVKITPQVSVSWNQDDRGVVISASSKDLSNQTPYYQWLTEETWEINSPLRSNYRVVRTPTLMVSQRSAKDKQDAYQCWATAFSSNILTASTSAQSDDIVSGFPVVTISKGSEKLDVRYSILVSQYAISKEAYEFYEVMKKNTEQMGSVFDPQPSLIRGNIISVTDPKETVVGFVDCSIVSSSRIFITSEQAGNWKSSPDCQKKYVQNSLVDLRRELANDDIMVADALIADYPNASGGEIILGYNLAYASCLDCRLRGNNIKPSFW